MSDTELLWFAVIVFLLLFIGLALTVYEFKTYIIEPEQKPKKQRKTK